MLPCGAFHHGLVVARSNRLALARCQSREFRPRPAALGRLFTAVDRPDMRRVSIEIRARDSKLALVRINPLPQLFARGVALQTGLALDAYEIGRNPVPVATAAAPAMK